MREVLACLRAGLLDRAVSGLEISDTKLKFRDAELGRDALLALSRYVGGERVEVQVESEGKAVTLTYQSRHLLPVLLASVFAIWILLNALRIPDLGYWVFSCWSAAIIWFFFVGFSFAARKDGLRSFLTQSILEGERSGLLGLPGAANLP